MKSVAVVLAFVLGGCAAFDFDNDIAVAGDAALNGGAGAITVSDSEDAYFVAADADSTAFCMGAAGALDLACLDTTDASPAWDIKGVTGQDALHVNDGCCYRIDRYDHDLFAKYTDNDSGALSWTCSWPCESKIILEEVDVVDLPCEEE